MRELSPRRSGWLVIGVGNEWRGDDAIGLLVARDLEGRGVSGLCAVQSNGDAAALIELWKGWDRVYLVDAMRSGSPPGTVVRVPASASDLPSRSGYRSSHLLGVEDAVRLSRILDHAPSSLVIFGIEGRTFELGVPICAEVEAAGREVAREILEEVLGPGGPGPTGPGPPAPSSPS